MRRYPALLQYLLFWAITQLFYFPTRYSGFVTDFTGLLSRFEGRTAAGILDCFGFPAMQQVLNALLFTWHSVFGIAPLPWYLLQSSLHALNALLLLQLGKALSERLQLPNTHLMGWMAAFLFLLSPYASEPVTWRVAQNFLLSTAVILGTARLTLDWLDKPDPRRWVLIQGLFILGLFTFELVLIIPFLSSLLLLMVPHGSWPKWRRLNLPQFGGVGLYFVLNRLILGSWVGHYGAEVHLKFELPVLLGNGLRYTAKHLLFARNWPHAAKQWLFDGLAQPAVALGLGGILIVLLTAGLIFRNRLSNRWRLSVIGLTGFGLALLPVLNLYFNYTLHLENDRYGYLASAFLALVLATGLSALPRWGRLPLLLAYLGCSSYFLWQHNQFWWKSTQVYQQMLDGFDYYDAPAAYLLNLPDNFQGAPMFRDYSGEDHAFRDALKYIRQQPYNGQIYEVAQYNMTRLTDGATATVDSTGTLRVEFNQWGNWWWRRGIGMGPGYDTEVYEVDSKGHHYFLTLRQPEQGAVFLIQEGLEWREVEY
jgi:hypothetical protein